MSSFQYRTMCELTFRHAYFLNNGTLDFDDFTEPEDKKAALKKFRFDDVFECIPLGETASKIKNHRMVVVYTQHGFRLTTRTANDDTAPIVIPSDDLFFVFALKAKDPNFQQYTVAENNFLQCYLFANELPENIITEVTDELTEEVTELDIPLLPIFSEETRVNRSFLMLEENTAFLKNNFLGTLDPSQLIGLIYLQVKSSENNKSLQIDFSDEEAEPPHFKIHFDNLETFWKYKKTSVGFEAETADKKPLTKYGYIEIKPDVDLTETYSSGDPEFKYHYPNPVPGNIEASGSDPEKIYSVIFI